MAHRRVPRRPGAREKLTAPEIVTALPVPLVDPTDVASTVLSATVLSQPVQTLESLRAARHGGLDSEGVDLSESVELPLMEVRALLDLGDVAKANRKLEDLAERVGWRWRLIWYRAVSDLLTGDYASATKHFTEVLDTFPGELAPKLALAATAELGNARRGTVLRDHLAHRQQHDRRRLRSRQDAGRGR